MVKSFFLDESGFVAPWTALSWSWVVGILAGATTLFGTVSPILANNTCTTVCCGVEVEFTCPEDCTIKCDSGACKVTGGCT